MRWQQTPISKKIISCFILSACSLGIINLQTKHSNNLIKQTPRINYLQEEYSQKKSINLQKLIPSFGFNNLRADWLYLNYLQYLGDKKARNNTGYSLIPNYFEAMIQYDPHFTSAYLTLSTTNSLYAGKPKQTIALVERVLESISPEISPDVSFLWTYKGLDELLYLGDTQAARRSYLTAAEWANRRGDNLGAKIAKQNLRTARFLASNPDIREAQLAAWSMILPNLKNKQNRQVVVNKIQALKSDLKFAPKDIKSENL